MIRKPRVRVLSKPQTTLERWMPALMLLVLAALVLVPLTLAQASVTVGKPAPGFTGMTDDGSAINLSDYRGKTVVLEWTNHGCPFVVRHYETGTIQSLQQDAAADDIVWLSVVSSAPGKQGYVTPEESKAVVADYGASPAAKILDPEGLIGRLYDAKTTPHMYIIDAEGVLRYQGAIDDEPYAKAGAETLAAHNYVRTALAQMASGEAVAPETTRPYGCSVKYAK